MLDKVPTDILIHISNYIPDNNDFLSLISTCKNIYNNDELYYYRLYRHPKFENIMKYRSHNLCLMRYLSKNGNNSKAIEVLLNCDNQPSSFLREGANYIMRWSCRKGDLLSLKKLINYGLNEDDIRCRQNEALVWSSESTDISVFSFIYEHYYNNKTLLDKNIDKIKENICKYGNLPLLKYIDTIPELNKRIGRIFNPDIIVINGQQELFEYIYQDKYLDKNNYFDLNTKIHFLEILIQKRNTTFFSYILDKMTTKECESPKFTEKIIKYIIDKNEDVKAKYYLFLEIIINKDLPQNFYTKWKIEHHVTKYNENEIIDYLYNISILQYITVKQYELIKRNELILKIIDKYKNINYVKHIEQLNN